MNSLKKPYFSIIVPFYNKEQTIKATIESLINQDFPQDNHEIILVNNNSTDNSISIVKEYPCIKLLHEKKQGVYEARNLGILNSKGAFTIFTDADVIAPRNWLSNIYTHLNKKKYDILIGWFIPAHSSKLLKIHSHLVEERIKRAIKEKNPSFLTACAANLVIKKELFESEGFFLTGYNSEDEYFPRRCLAKGYNVGFEENINIERTDINSLWILLLKNFIYGSASSRCSEYKLTLKKNKKYFSITKGFMFKYLHLSPGLALISLSYHLGYLFGRLNIFRAKKIHSLVRSYTEYTNKKGL